MIIFISGGVRSGKSSLAERMAIEYYEQRQSPGLYYVATTKRSDDEEMAERIKLHRASRSSLWTTIEEPYRIDEALVSLPDSAVVLIDCLTVWSSNVLFSEKKNAETMVGRLAAVKEIADAKSLAVVVVSNDLNEELPIEDEGVQRYVASLEAVHKYVAAQADRAIQVVAGCPAEWK
ncbi:MAG: bifunctional adenosylcobinamide kinase/adenosylcobinamide-phosphate guanylyltransferase [Bacillus sp. (in: firmicutes)]